MLICSIVTIYTIKDLKVKTQSLKGEKLRSGWRLGAANRWHLVGDRWPQMCNSRSPTGGRAATNQGRPNTQQIGCGYWRVFSRFLRVRLWLVWLPLVLGVIVYVFCVMRRVVTCSCVCIVKCKSVICVCGVRVLRFSFFFLSNLIGFRIRSGKTRSSFTFFIRSGFLYNSIRSKPKIFWVRYFAHS